MNQHDIDLVEYLLGEEGVKKVKEAGDEFLNSLICRIADAKKEV